MDENVIIVPDQQVNIMPMRKRTSRVNLASTERKKSLNPID